VKPRVLVLIALSLACLCTSSGILAANVNFSNATVLLVETRSDAWGSWMIITLKDSSGNRIMKLCDTAGDTAAIALPLSDSAAKPILAIALTAKATGSTVTGWGIDPPLSGSWCRIGNFAIFP
jgi:hypothetical protein